MVKLLGRFLPAYVGDNEDEFVVPLTSSLTVGEFPGLRPSTSCLIVGGVRGGTTKSYDIAALAMLDPVGVGRVNLGPRWRRRLAGAVHMALHATATVWRTADGEEKRTAQMQNVLLVDFGNRLTEVYGRDDRALDYVHHLSASYGWLLFRWRGRWLMLAKPQRARSTAQYETRRVGWRLVLVDVAQAHNCTASGVY